MSAFCGLCSRDPDTGEFFCARLGELVEKCPNFPDGYPWDAERETRQEDGGLGTYESDERSGQ